MNEHDATLCRRIREHCRRQRWYAGDKYNTRRFTERGERYERYYDKDGNEVVIDNDPDDEPRKSGFASPLATEEQMLATEQALGFPLPSLLRTLYRQLANGGFGPGYGLIGALGGFGEAGNLVEMHEYHARRAQLIALETYRKQIKTKVPLELSDTLWPQYMLYLCDWGEANVSCIDCVTGIVFLVRMGEKHHRYLLEFQAASLQAWLEQWLDGNMQ